jgi:hypothetical protein
MLLASPLLVYRCTIRPIETPTREIPEKIVVVHRWLPPRGLSSKSLATKLRMRIVGGTTTWIKNPDEYKRELKVPANLTIGFGPALGKSLHRYTIRR